MRASSIRPAWCTAAFLRVPSSSPPSTQTDLPSPAVFTATYDTKEPVQASECMLSYMPLRQSGLRCLVRADRGIYAKSCTSRRADLCSKATTTPPQLCQCRPSPSFALLTTRQIRSA
ncbi:hypothetical protein PENSPDRAFT_333169 [Peniophora sp. CONT]|nr:hypothetical protein PENSPDRAFT_333169 [Peniophora sp. CONT]